MNRYLSTAALAMALCSAPAFAQDAASPQGAADAFVIKVEADLARIGKESAQASWVYQTYINQDSEAVAARADAAVGALAVKSAIEAARHAGTSGLSYDTARKLSRLRTAITLPATTDAQCQAPGDLRQGQGYAARGRDQRQRHRGRDGHQPQPGRAQGNVAVLA
jgi:peptidyl-dipeptidase A